MSNSGLGEYAVERCNVRLERDGFLRNLLAHLSNTLEHLVGLKEAEGFISIVGQAVGQEIEEEYKGALGVLSEERFTRRQVADIMVDLKRRINGDFYIIEESDDKIVLGNRKCPFEEEVIGRESLCMMTSNVFGTIAAQNLGYAKVELDETIARGDSGCRIVIYLRKTDEAEQAPGREYFKV